MPEAQITNHLIFPKSGGGGLTKVGKIPDNSGLFLVEGFPKRGVTTLQVYDYSTALYIFIATLEDISDLISRRSQFFSSFWRKYDILKSFLLSVGGAITAISFLNLSDDSRANLPGYSRLNIGATIFVTGAILAFLKPLNWLLLHRRMGPLVVTINKVIRDVCYIFFIYLIYFGAFTVSLYFMFHPFHQNKDGPYRLLKDDLVTFKGVWGGMFWRILDPGTIEGSKEL